MMNKNNAFKVGYFDFHKDPELNFQLNRFYTYGAFTKEELLDIGSRIDGFDKWISLFCELGEKTEKEGNPFKAATCFRAAQFFTLSGEKDTEGNSLKHTLYDRCIKLYNEYFFSSYENLSFARVPFKNCELPVYYSTCEDPKGTIVIHGGYDSISQEFLVMLPYLTDKNYNVYFFEGPGQGEVLMHYDVRMTPKWEDCTGAVLDYFGLDDVTLIGVSLGGYLGTRAAAYEKRISRLVMFDLMYDFYGAILNKMGSFGKVFDYLTRHKRNILWKWLNKKFDEKYFTKWLLLQGYAIYENISTPYEYFNHIKEYNTREISKLITQDTLVLAGASDIYTVYYQDQLDALVNARSVTGRLFTKEEHADHHCQVGNMGLVLDTIAGWIEEKTNGEKTGTDRREEG
ncbi:Pimeloyl-ACP methyl ester carboxylesterase [Butyrivibrio fibrisolvens DSM 3071]|uniref:Pimeloyl-ACP methyl ester carboxylesterase n=1 Tax=Butyrivibrio fibrisolvens DSM 3071 TaxID=1121131 RepID=A0A1M6D182_BUTFI|nr:alpha/beta hydrolase [Butyrivibrio fibrisolvens]SHI66980.1 Pimeloyl-ACP methyl ester carboxylesterase [Butyrivibrio fibrisolvens DSM 3071]